MGHSQRRSWGRCSHKSLTLSHFSSPIRLAVLPFRFVLLLLLLSISGSPWSSLPPFAFISVSASPYTTSSAQLYSVLPSYVPQPVLWLSANHVPVSPANTAVTDWTDLTGAGNDATTSTASQAPLYEPSVINGFPVLRFDGTKQLTGPLVWPTSDWSIMSLVSVSTASQPFLYIVGSLSTPDHALFITGQGSVYNAEFFSAGGGGSSSSATLSQLSTPVLVTATYTAGTVTLFQNGSQVGTVGWSSGGDPSFIVAGGFYGDQLQGDMAELLFFHSALSTQSRTWLESELAAMYGIGYPTAAPALFSAAAAPTVTPAVSSSHSSSLSSSPLSSSSLSSSVKSSSPSSSLSSSHSSSLSSSLLSSTVSSSVSSSPLSSSASSSSATGGGGGGAGGSAYATSSAQLYSVLPSYVPQPVLWLSANHVPVSPANTAVTDWTDLTGAGNDATTSTASQAPLYEPSVINGFPVLRFDGTKQLTGPLVWPTSDWSIMSLVSVSTASQPFLYIVGSLSTPDHALFITGQGSVYNAEFFSAGGGGSSSSATLSQLSTPVLVTATYTAGTVTLFQNGSQVGTVGWSSGGDPSFIVAGGFYGDQLQGDMAELLFFHSALSTQSRTWLESELAAMYGIGYPTAAPALFSAAAAPTVTPAVSSSHSSSLSSSPLSSSSLSSSVKSSSPSSSLSSSHSSSLSSSLLSSTVSSSVSSSPLSSSASSSSATGGGGGGAGGSAYATSSAQLYSVLPSYVPQPVLWLSANHVPVSPANTAVTDWTDLTGAGNDATTSTASQAPLYEPSVINGFPVLRFDGTKQLTGPLVWPTSDWSIMSLVSVSTASQPFLYIVGSLSTPDHALFITGQGSVYNAEFFSAGGGGSSSSATLSQLSTPVLVTATYTAGTVTLFQNGSQVGTVGWSSGGDPSFIVAGGFYGDQLQGDMAELLFFHSALSTQSRTWLESELAAMYGIGYPTAAPALFSAAAAPTVTPAVSSSHSSSLSSSPLSSSSLSSSVKSSSPSSSLSSSHSSSLSSSLLSSTVSSSVSSSPLSSSASSSSATGGGGGGAGGSAYATSSAQLYSVLPSYVPQPVLWLSANHVPVSPANTAVTDWTDLTGAGNDATTSTASQAPLYEPSVINGFPVLRFDGTKQLTGPLVWPTSDWSIMSLVSVSTASQPFLYIVGSLSTPDHALFITGQGSVYNAEFFSAGGGGSSSSATLSQLSTPVLVTATYTAGTVTLFQNGSQVGTVGWSSGGDPSFIVAGGFYGDQLQGDMAELLFFHSALSTQSRTWLESELAAMYGIGYPTAAPALFSAAAAPTVTPAVSSSHSSSLSSSPLSSSSLSSSVKSSSPSSSLSSSHSSSLSSSLLSSTVSSSVSSSPLSSSASSSSATGGGGGGAGGSAYATSSAQLYSVLPSYVPQPVLWLSANHVPVSPANTAVTDWTDLTGAGNDATTSTASQAPLYEPSVINGFPVLRFDGTKQLTGPLVWPTSDWSIMSLVSVSTASQPFLYIVGSLSTPDHALFITGQGSVYNAEFFSAGGGGSSSSATLSQLSTPVLVTATYTAGTVTLFQNGSQVGTVGWSSGGDPSFIVAGGFYGDQLQGDMAELLFFHSALSTQSRTWLESELAAMYGIGYPTAAPALFSAAAAPTVTPAVSSSHSSSLSSSPLSSSSLSSSVKSSSPSSSLSSSHSSSLSSSLLSSTVSSSVSSSPLSSSASSSSATGGGGGGAGGSAYATSSAQLYSVLPSYVPQPVLWLSANHVPVSPANTAVTDWTDLTGAGNDATTSTASQAPLYEPSVINGFPVLRFDGTKQLTGPLVWPTSDWSIMSLVSVSHGVAALPVHRGLSVDARPRAVHHWTGQRVQR